MDGNLMGLMVSGIINILCIIGSSYGKPMKPLIILSGLVVIWFGFQWGSWLGAVGSYVAILVIIGILRSTALKRTLDDRQRGQ